MTIPRRSARRTYNRVAASADGASLATDRSSLNEPLAPPNDGNNNTSSGNDLEAASSNPERASATGADPLKEEDDDDDDENTITVIVLDPAQKRFPVKGNSQWTVLQFKKRAAQVHHVPAPSQRLIYRGQLLADASTLSECGISESDTIVHLFPKPQVVVTSSTSNVSAAAAAEGPRGAHVPQIILDEAEAERRSQILILSSVEIFEAQHRVKLLSFLLLIVCSMELLTLFTILLGVPDDDGMNGTDDDNPPGNPTDPTNNSSTGGDNDQMRSWQNSDYADLAISAFGFYVATLGIKATTENTVALARLYLWCLVLVGIAWNVYKYLIYVQAEQEAVDEEEVDLSPTAVYTQAMVAMLLPIFVWMICFLRAWQFQQLLREAEQEALERRREEEEEEAAADEENPAPVLERTTTAGSSSIIITSADENELTLQVEGRTIT